MKCFISIMTMRIRWDLVLVIRECTIGVSRKGKGYVSINFVARKMDSSKTKVRNIKITRMMMLGQVAKHLFNFTLTKMGSG